MNGKVLDFTKACIATGSKSKIPNIKDIETVPYFTTDTCFNMTIQPKKLAVIGTGRESAELGSAF